LWFVFIGHGAPSKDGKDGVLVGADAQQDADSLYERSLPRGELLSLLSKGRQARTVVIIDACFSGRSPSGEALVAGLQPLVVTRAQPAGADKRLVLLTAAKSDQFAGPLPKSVKMRPAFSYLALGALRGWAADENGKVTAGAVAEFARRSLSLDKTRTQTPELSAGAPDSPLAVGREAAPDLAKIDREGRGAGSAFQVTELASVPQPRTPKAIDASASGLDLGKLDVDALQKYDTAVNFDKSDADPEEKAASWRKLASEAPQFADPSKSRAEEWEKFSEQSRAQETAKQERIPARDSDWRKLSKFLTLGVVPEADKKRWSAQFLSAYLDSPGLERDMAKELLPHVAAGPKERALTKILSAPPDLSSSSTPKEGDTIFTSDSGDFKIALPPSWVKDPAHSEQYYEKYVFGNPASPAQKLYILYLGRYRNYSPSGNAAYSVYADAEQFVDFTKLLIENNELVAKKRKGLSGGRKYWELAGSWPAKEKSRCSEILPELCDGGTFRIASFPTGPGMIVLIGSGNGIDDKEAAALYKEFRRTFVLLKADPAGDAL